MMTAVLAQDTWPVWIWHDLIRDWLEAVFEVSTNKSCELAGFEMKTFGYHGLHTESFHTFSNFEVFQNNRKSAKNRTCFTL